MVLKNPVRVAAAHLAALAALEGRNARPPQPLYGRRVLDVGA